MEIEHVFEAGFGAMLFYVIYLVFVAGIGIASYIFRSLGVYTIAKRRGIRRPWMAWVPVADQYMLGCISDQYQYVVKGKNKNKRSVLLWLNIVMMLLSMAVMGSAVAMMVKAVQAAIGGISEDQMFAVMMSPMMGVMGLSLPMMILSIVTMVFRYIAMYDLYTSCNPANNVMFLVLSIVFTVTEPFFVFFIRNKDEGMPPRKTETPAETVVEIPMPVEEAPKEPEIDPWERPYEE